MSTPSRQQDDRLIERIRRRLDESVAELDEATLSRLAQARQRALSAEPGHSRRARRWIRSLAVRPASDWLVPAGALASVVATVLALALTVSEPENGLARQVEDLDLLSAGEELELYENLEFYQWLDEREQTG